MSVEGKDITATDVLKQMYPGLVADGWEVIETAPKDGTRVLLADSKLDRNTMMTAIYLDYCGVWAVDASHDKIRVTLPDGWAKYWRHLPS